MLETIILSLSKFLAVLAKEEKQRWSSEYDCGQRTDQSGREGGKKGRIPPAPSPPSLHFFISP